MRTAAQSRRHAGYSLVEIMIALALGAAVVAAIGQIYSANKHSSTLSQALSQVNENGRFAVEYLTNDLRMAGYLSCGGSSAQLGNTVQQNTDHAWLYRAEGIGGFDGTGDSLPSALAGRVRAGTDVVIVRRLEVSLRNDGPSVLNINSGNGTVQLDIDVASGETVPYWAGEILALSNRDCSQTTLFQITDLVDSSGAGGLADALAHSVGGSSNPGNCTTHLGGGFDCLEGTPGPLPSAEGASLTRFVVHAYFVTASDPPYLARLRLPDPSTAESTAFAVDNLISGIEDFQVEFGVDRDGDGTAENYLAANSLTATDWERPDSGRPVVISVRLGLLIRSDEENVRIDAESQQFELLDPSNPVSSPVDKRLRRAFTTIVALRNHLN